MFDDTVATLDSLASVELKLIEAQILLKACRADSLKFSNEQNRVIVVDFLKEVS